MVRLKLGPIVDDKPVKVAIELPAQLHRDLKAYADALGTEQGVIVPMLERFIATDRGFSKVRQRARSRG